MLSKRDQELRAMYRDNVYKSKDLEKMVMVSAVISGNVIVDYEYENDRKEVRFQAKAFDFKHNNDGELVCDDEGSKSDEFFDRMIKETEFAISYLQSMVKAYKLFGGKDEVSHKG